MTPDTAQDIQSLLNAKVIVPQHVVYRSFPSETVVLNLETGRYHGLNTTAGRMLQALEQATSVGAAIAAIAAEYNQPEDTIERDAGELCNLLLDRGLIEIESAAP